MYVLLFIVSGQLKINFEHKKKIMQLESKKLKMKATSAPLQNRKDPGLCSKKAVQSITQFPFLPWELLLHTALQQWAKIHGKKCNFGKPRALLFEKKNFEWSRTEQVRCLLF